MTSQDKKNKLVDVLATMLMLGIWSAVCAIAVSVLTTNRLNEEERQKLDEALTATAANTEELERRETRLQTIEKNLGRVVKAVYDSNIANISPSTVLREVKSVGESVRTSRQEVQSLRDLIEKNQ